MTTLQFSLFFAAILIAYVLVHVRLVRFEERMGELARLRSLDERLQRFEERTSAGVDLARVEQLLERVHGDLVEVRQATRAVESAVEAAATNSAARPVTPAADAGSPGVPPPPPATASAGERVRAAIETRLLALGYGDLRILGDLSRVTLDDSYEIRVECTRDRMPFKGAVTVRNGGVADVDLQIAAPMFP